MLRGVPFYLVLLTVCWISAAEALECFSCSNIGNSSDCFTVSRCAGDEKCYTEASYSGNDTVFTLGCLNKMQCVTSTTEIPVSIVGRQIHGRSTSMPCQQCCGTNYCNKQLCTHIAGVLPTTDQCIDDPDYHCAFIGTTFNLCADAEHAAAVCRKFCDLCDYADGGWSSWSAWTSCYSSCGQGRHSRFRTCTEPSPAHGGHDCRGDHQEMSNCTVGACPVHGGWTSWTSWESCSVTCGVGLERRDRSCSSPYPGSDGNPCFGDSRDDRVCFLRACADGGWSEWSQWSECSATCNGGLKTRSRNCDDPAPSLYGKSCVGNSDGYSACNTHACPVPVVVFSVALANATLVGATPA